MKLPKELLKAALMCAATDKTHKGRPMLNGVYVEQAAGGAWIVATDGSVVFAAWHATTEVLGALDVIIPRAALEAALKLDKAQDLDVTPTHLGALAYSPLDMTFPPWRRVLPGATLSGQHPVRVDAHLLSRVVSAMNVANGAKDHGLNVALFADTDSYVVRGVRAKCLARVMAARNLHEYEPGKPVEYEPLGA